MGERKARAKVDPYPVATLPNKPRTIKGKGGKRHRGHYVKYKGKEVWKDVIGWESHYQVSSHGRVKSLPREWKLPHTGGICKYKGKILSNWLSTNGILCVSLKRSGRGRDEKKNIAVHTLVAKAFVVQPSPEKDEVNHKDYNRFNNDPNNLEWVTHQENMDHAVQNLLLQYGTRHWKSKLTPKKVRRIRERLAKGHRLKHIAKDYKVHTGTISAIRDGINWRWLK